MGNRGKGGSKGKKGNKKGKKSGGGASKWGDESIGRHDEDQPVKKKRRMTQVWTTDRPEGERMHTAAACARALSRYCVRRSPV